MVIEIESESGYTDCHDSDVEGVPVMLEHFHVLAEFNSYPGEEIAPGQGAYEGEDDKHQKVGF